MLHFKGQFNTNYWAKFQIYAMIFSVSNLLVSKLYFVGKSLNINTSGPHECLTEFKSRLLQKYVKSTYQQKKKNDLNKPDESLSLVFRP